MALTVMISYSRASLFVVICLILALALGSTGTARAHSHSGEDGSGNCVITGDHTHTSTAIDADTVEAQAWRSCTGVEAIARWTVDSVTYVDVHTDTTCCVYAASAGTTEGWDVFHSSDHKGKDGSTWFTLRLWH